MAKDETNMKSITDFNGGPPMGQFEPERATTNFRASLHMVGGSSPDEGKFPLDNNEFRTGMPSREDWLGNKGQGFDDVM